MAFPQTADRRIAAYQHELLETHYREVENMYREMRGWRHDYRNHIQLLKTYAHSGDLGAVSAYLDKLETDLTRVDTVVKTGNRMADAILNSKISLAKSKGIPVRADAHIPVALAVSDLDLCVILGNLFDNAIEASLRLPEAERMIRVYMDTKGTQLYISFYESRGGRETEKGKRPLPHDEGRGARLRALPASTAWWSASAATSAGRARPARSRPRSCYRRPTRSSSPKRNDSSPECAGGVFCCMLEAEPQKRRNHRERDKKDAARYNMAQNAGYMIALAWREERAYCGSACCSPRCTSRSA